METNKEWSCFVPSGLWHLSTLMESGRALFQTHYQLCNVLHHNFLNDKPKLPGTLLVEEMG